MCDVSLCSGPQLLAKLQASRVLQSRLLFCGLTLCFPGICEFLFSLNLYQNRPHARTQTQRPGFFAILFDFNLLSSLLLIVCLYAISCCLPCILIKVLFILRLSLVQCLSLVQTKPQSDFV